MFGTRKRGFVDGQTARGIVCQSPSRMDICCSFVALPLIIVELQERTCKYCQKYAINAIATHVLLVYERQVGDHKIVKKEATMQEQIAS